MRRLLLVAVIASAAGAWGGVWWWQHHAAAHDLHWLLHNRLDLSTAQTQQIEGLEQDFDGKQTALEAQMRAANRDLAAAIAVHHQYDAAADAAVARSHQAMAALQQLTIRHVLAMRAVLDARQAALLDHYVDQALTESGS